MADNQASEQPASSSPAGEGSFRVAPQVVRKVVALAATDVSGIHATGAGPARAGGATRERVPDGGTSAASGVRVEVGPRDVAVDLDVVVEYGAPLVEVTRAVRDNVIAAVEGSIGMRVVEVNIAVNDVHLSEQDSSGGPAPNARAH